MEAFAMLGNLVNKIGGFGNLLKGGLTGMGAISNILAQRKQAESLNRMLYYQKHPEAAAAKIRSLTEPLSMGLTQSVGNEVQGYLGERGLSESPNITAQVLSQSLAPYAQHNTDVASQLFANILNPAGATFRQPADLTPLLALWNKPAQVNPGGTGGTPPFTDPGMYFPSVGAGSDPYASGGAPAASTDATINPLDTYSGGYGGGVF
jgi:hypothetical protein